MLHSFTHKSMSKVRILAFASGQNNTHFSKIEIWCEALGSYTMLVIISMVNMNLCFGFVSNTIKQKYCVCMVCSGCHQLSIYTSDRGSFTASCTYALTACMHCEQNQVESTDLVIMWVVPHGFVANILLVYMSNFFFYSLRKFWSKVIG